MDKEAVGVITQKDCCIIEVLFHCENADYCAVVIPDRIAGIKASLQGGRAEGKISTMVPVHRLCEVGTELIRFAYKAILGIAVGRSDGYAGAIHKITDRSI